MPRPTNHAAPEPAVLELHRGARDAVDRSGDKLAGHTARTVTGLAGRFTALVRDSEKGKTITNDQDADAAADIAAWITQARSCDAPAIAMFASGLEADIAAVRAALTEPWSSSQPKARSTVSSSSNASATDGQASIS